MSYASIADMSARYDRDELVQLTDRENPAGGDLDTDIIQAALDDADGEINSYLAARVATPVAPVPRVLIGKACAIARYLLWKDRASDKVKDDYDVAIQWLRDFAVGKVSLGDNTAATEPSSGGTPQFTAPCRTFSKDTLKDF